MRVKFTTLVLAGSALAVAAHALAINVSVDWGFPCNAGFVRPDGAKTGNQYWPNWLQYTKHSTFPTTWPTSPSETLTSEGEAPEVHPSTPVPSSTPNPQNSFYGGKYIKDINPVYPIWFNLLSELTGESYFVDVCLPAISASTANEENRVTITYTDLLGNYLGLAAPSVKPSIVAHNCPDSVPTTIPSPWPAALRATASTDTNTGVCTLTTTGPVPLPAGQFSLNKPYYTDVVVRLSIGETTETERSFSGDTGQFVVHIEADGPPPLPISAFYEKWTNSQDSSLNYGTAQAPIYYRCDEDSQGIYVRFDSNSFKWQGPGNGCYQDGAWVCYFSLDDIDNEYNKDNVKGELNPTHIKGFTYILPDSSGNVVRFHKLLTDANDTVLPGDVYIVWDREAVDVNGKPLDTVCKTTDAQDGVSYGIWARLYRNFGGTWKACRAGFFRNAAAQAACPEPTGDAMLGKLTNINYTPPPVQ
jgi:hypothetical protein